jgi:hypothetical protein
MSVVPTGFANDSTSMYEDNTPIITTGNLVSGLGSVPIAPDEAVNYTLVPPRPYAGDPTQPVSYLMTVNVLFAVNVPAGQIDTSEIQINIGGNPTVPVIDRDIFGGQKVYITDSVPDLVYTVCGVVLISKNQSVDMTIERVGGNAAVGWTLVDVSSRSKRLA